MIIKESCIYNEDDNQRMKKNIYKRPGKVLLQAANLNRLSYTI